MYSGTGERSSIINNFYNQLILLRDPVNYVHIKDCASAKDVWDKLKATFQDSGLTRRVTLLRSLTTARLDNFDSMEEYVNFVISTSHKLNGIKFVVSDEWIGTLLLAGLPEHYRPMIMGVESSGVQISSDSIKTLLLQDVKTHSTVNSAFFGASNSKPYSSSTNQRVSKKKFKKGIRCYSCNDYGHKASDCQSKKSKSNNKFTNAKKDNSNVFCAVYSTGLDDKNNWYVDSGASEHLTMRNDWLHNKDMPKIKEIIVANNSKLPIESCGKVFINVNCQGSVEKIPMNNVQYVPNLSTNLFSVAQLAVKGYTVTFNIHGCRITNINGEVVAIAKLVNNVYQLVLAENCCFLASGNVQ